MHDTRPTEDFSKTLWSLELSCFELGMSREETFVFADTSKTNKYRRDRRSSIDLWREVCKAEVYADIPDSDLKHPSRSLSMSLHPNSTA
jgi:hypothetical protein